jgi:hypothetical protein
MSVISDLRDDHTLRRVATPGDHPELKALLAREMDEDGWLEHAAEAEGSVRQPACYCRHA